MVNYAVHEKDVLSYDADATSLFVRRNLEPTLVRSHHLWHILRRRLRHTTDEISELWKLIIIGLIIRYHHMVRVEAIMAYGSQGSYLLCVLELHLGPSEEA